MMSSGAFAAMLAGMALCAPPGQLPADKPDSGYELAKGTAAVAVMLHKDHKVPDGAVPGTAVDIVGEISEPIKTAIALLHVKLLAVDAKLAGVKRAEIVIVELTPAQAEVLALMRKHGTKLALKVRDKKKPKQ